MTDRRSEDESDPVEAGGKAAPEDTRITTVEVSGQTENLQTVRTFCRVCEPACGLLATVRNGRMEALSADRDHPVSSGFVCNKGIYGADIHNDPDRLRYPLKQVSPGRFERIGWDQAMAEIAARLRAVLDRHGAEAVGSYTGNPTAFNTLYAPSFGRFMRQLGARTHFSSGTQDCANKFAASEAVFGTRTLHPIPDIDHSDFILIVGENPAVSHMSFLSTPNPMARLKAAVRRGARLVHVNPRRTESARMAGELVQVRPDTDVYLLAALIHEIDRSVGFDENAQAHGEHLDELRSIVAAYPPERVADVTGIETGTIRALARDFARAPRACAHMSTGVNMGRQGTLAYWLLQMLVFVAGNLGRRGGNYYSEGFYSRAMAAGRAAPAVDPSELMLKTPFGDVRRPGGVGISLPGNLLASYVSEGQPPVRALFVNSGNPVLSIGGEAGLRQAMEALELLVCVDIYRNATGEYAHYLLPAAGAFEREDVNLAGLGMQAEPWVQYTPAVVSPAFERRPDWWIYERLAREMGFESVLDRSAVDDQGNSTPPELWGRIDAMLRSRGHDLDTLRRAGIIRLEHADPESFYDRYVQREGGTVDCAPPAFGPALQRMESIFREMEREPPGTLRLIGKRDAYSFNSWYANVEKLKSKRETNYLYMNPDDAALRQIDEGCLVRVWNEHGSIRVPVKLTDELRPGVVALPHGWGHEQSRGMSRARRAPGVNANALLPSGPDSFEPLSNQAHMTGIRVEVAPSPASAVAGG